MTPTAPINPDEIMDPKRCAEVFSVTESWLAADRAKTYPVLRWFNLGRKTPRYHFRTVAACLARRAQIDAETIAASFGTNPKANL